jgi:hypothetical protein
LLLCRLGGEEAQELSELAAVLGVLMNAKFQVLAERLVELLEVILVLRDLAEEDHALLNDVLADDLQHFVLLERLTGDIEGEIL